MALEPENSPTLAQAAAFYLNTLPAPDRQDGLMEVNRFARWYGQERPVRNITPRDVESYVENVGTTVTEVAKRMEPLKAFFAYARKEGLVTSNLASSIRVRKSGTRSQQPLVRVTPDAVQLTKEGLAQLETDLAALKSERPKIAESRPCRGQDQGDGGYTKARPGNGGQQLLPGDDGEYGLHCGSHRPVHR
ncbi:MAG: GreA/GreB family elongation factor [Dehalococcoidia bacterium]|nr:GreA/GreB family elongation factor [Dehalococcoidia bacterium]